jgi:predicted CXXCH cytochrome family protein
MRNSRFKRCLLVILLLGAAYGGWRWFTAPDPEPIPDLVPGPTETALDLSPTACGACHPAQFESWHRTYHRTMTREATPETVKGDFNDGTNHYRGFTTRMTREGDAYFMSTLDPGWSELLARAGGQADRVPPPRHVKIRVDRLVGSHWLQECLHRQENGQYIRLPVLYHIAERRWVHTAGAFLAPESEDFWARSRGANWNESCLYCHNTEPSKNPIRGPHGSPVGYETEVAELGIACAACHGRGEQHVRQHETLRAGAQDDIVHPGRLSVPRRDDICARCHGALAPKPAMWDPRTHRDPFVPGQDLRIFNHLFHSEAHQAELAGLRPVSPKPPPPDATDGRFWGDGTPLTTALEFNGMALSACYQGGNGSLSCLSCHTMHGNDPNMLLKPKMRTNEACFQCHPGYRTRVAEHTRHASDSAGSLCVNCHMAPQVYSLMTTHRSHRIETPTLAGSLGSGKPHACNLCHLDQSLGWTKQQLAQWPNGDRTAAGKLSADEEAIASALLILSRRDARSRVVVAGAFSNAAARQASGTDWFGSVLTRSLEHERYPAVRELLGRTLSDLTGAKSFDPLASPGERLKQLTALRQRFDAMPVLRPLPGIPLLPTGRPDETRFQHLRDGRHDPDLTVNE